MGDNFQPALIVVDFQEDFCPPHGSLAVADGRDIAPIVNSLLSLPFVAKIATKDWHPADHISFASNHADASPFTSTTTITNPANPSESYASRLWPVHCVQNTSGASLVPELEAHRLTATVEKGHVRDVEMYSAFRDPYGVVDSGLAETLRGQGVTDVFVVGLAGDYCVKCTAVDAARDGFRTYVVEEGTRCVEPDKWEACKDELEAGGVRVVSVEGAEVRRVRDA
ncbi:Nicotinamidase like protein [Verticillium longisporum]|uniref:Nicotinamidase like protein n=1 Tax=Verticillium longisporum TaxID=100787 RepID=A0A8I2ZZY7_VERLO|nr:Nicotinamidase like protein [Verticillium longisporum]